MSMSDTEEKLLQELSSAYEQLALFYDWNQQFGGKKSQESFTDILRRLTTATSSTMGLVVSMGRGRSLSVLSAFNEDGKATEESLKRFKLALPDMESKLHWNYAITLEPTESHSQYMVVVPWRSDSILKGVFLYQKDQPYTKQETILLANASSEIVSMIEQSTLTRKLQDKNNELALYLVKDLSELKAILSQLQNLQNFCADCIKMISPQGVTVYFLMLGVIKHSSDPDSIGKLSEQEFPKQVSAMVMGNKEGELEVDSVRYIIKLTDSQEPALGCHVIKSAVPLPSDKPSEIFNFFKKFTQSMNAIEQSAIMIQRLYNSHLLSMSKLTDAMHPLLSAKNDNAMQVIRIISKALEFNDNQREALEMSSILSDISLIYLDKRSLEEYLLKGTLISGPDTLRKVREHPLKSAEMISPVKSLSECTNIIKWHHERWDGYGYPDGLKGEEIPLLARALSVAQGLTSRSIHHYMSVDDLLSDPVEIDWLKRQSGKAYDPSIVKALFNAVGVF